MNLQLVLMAARPAATCLVAGGLKALTDYQAGQHWVPSLVDGGITALVVAGSMLGIGGAVSGVRAAAGTTAATRVPPPA